MVIDIFMSDMLTMDGHGDVVINPHFVSRAFDMICYMYRASTYSLLWLPLGQEPSMLTRQ